MSRSIATRSVAIAAALTATLVAGSAWGGPSANLRQPPVNVVSPSISGTAHVGSTLTASPGTWTGRGLKYAYQWLQCDSNGAGCAAVRGANATTYSPTSNDLGTLRVLVTASNRYGSTAATSAATSVVTATTDPASSTTTSVGTSDGGGGKTSLNGTESDNTATTTTSTTTTTATSGSVLYKADFDDGANPPTGWSKQCDNLNDPARGTLTLDGSVYSSASYSGRFNLSATQNACELLHSRLAGNHNDDYYAFGVNFDPVIWNQIGDPTSLNQFDYEGINGSPLAMAVGKDFVDITINSGKCPPDNPYTGCPYFSGSWNGGYTTRPAGMPGPLRAVPKGQLTLGVWHQFIVHVYWTTDLNGVVQVWHREKGQTSWTKTVDIGPAQFAFPTLQWGTNFLGYTVSPENISNYGTNDKFGMYTGVGTAHRYWFDDWCRGTTFDAATHCLS
jgi:hypothetical protein